MNTAIPTPFDIIDPGPGVLLPTGLAWLALVSFAILSLTVFTLLRRTPRPHSIRKTLRMLLDELNVATAHVTHQKDIERVTRIARRILSPYTSLDVGSMTSSELRGFAASLGQSTDEATRAVSPLLLLLAEVEERAYAPLHNMSGDDNTLHDILQRLRSALEDHVTRFQPL